uniref:CSON015049 protein n=1 Tax=Culicoides sonorensis TaxID=179676 RepID=A0A336LS31_CULSO
MNHNIIQEILSIDSEIADHLFNELEHLCENPFDETAKSKIDTLFNEAEEKIIIKAQEMSLNIIDLTNYSSDSSFDETDSDSDETIVLSDASTPTVAKSMRKSYLFGFPLANKTESRKFYDTPQHSNFTSLNIESHNFDSSSFKDGDVTPQPESCKVDTQSNKRWNLIRKSVLFRFPKRTRDKKQKYYNTPPLSKKMGNNNHANCENNESS